MSTPPRHIAHTHTPATPVRAACMCVHGGACSIFAPGHAMHLIQSRLAAATPSEWVDAIVESAGADGTLTVRSIADASSITVWSAGGAADAVREGTPVALHGRYHVLAVGSSWFNVLSD